MAEQEVYAHLRELAERNVSAEDEVSFLGAGMYDAYVPALIEMLTERSEFLTPYTPYQPEVSQGGLQVMFEYQTAISRADRAAGLQRLGLRGPLGAGGGRLPREARQRQGPLRRLPRRSPARPRRPCAPSPAATASRSSRRRCATASPTATAWREAIDGDTAAVFLQQPNFLGAVEDVPALAAAARATPVVVCACDPQTLGVLRPPGECGVDVAVGEGQSLGNRLDFGGPSFGFFAATEEHLRRMPGRIAGETTDLDGERGFVLTLQTREQHIRRERATSNICTSQALNALAGVVYLTWLGRRGIVELGELLARRTAYARERLGELAGRRPLHEQPVVREFAVAARAPTSTAVRRSAAARRRRQPGLSARAPITPSTPDGLLVALTEQRTRADIDRLADVAGAMPWRPSAEAAWREDDLRARRSRPAGVRLPADRRARARPLEELLPAGCAAATPPRLPEVSEPELVRHYVNLSKRNFDLDSGFYPLGSCTMKHNPRLHERVAALPGNARLHPLQDPTRAQGALELMWSLQAALAEIAGLPHVSLQPSAGSHGELAGLLLTRAYHEDRGEAPDQGPDPRHRARHQPGDGDDGRLEVVKVGTAPDGGVDLDDLRAKADEDVACLMLTNPNTLGLFDAQDRGDRRDRPRGRRDALLRRRQPERGDGYRAARRHGLRHRPLQPAQDVHPAARRRRPRLGPDRLQRADRALPDGAAARPRRGRPLRPRLRAAEVDRPAARLPGQLRRPSSAPTPTSARSAPTACATPARRRC